MAELNSGNDSAAPASDRDSMTPIDSQETGRVLLAEGPWQPRGNVFVSPVSPDVLPGDPGCKPSPDFIRVIDTAARNIYDVKSMGDIEAIKKGYCDTGRTADALDAAQNALKRTGDPYNSLFRGQKSVDLDALFEGRDHTIGVDFQIPGLDATTREPRKGPFVINEIIKGSPAEKAGLRAGDVISTVNGVSTSMIKYTRLGEILDNPDRQPVNLGIIRDGQPRDITVTPEEMTVPAVSDTLLPGDIAYIKVEDFMQRDTVEEMRAAIEKYPQARGFVIDVRDNTGGLFDQGITSASLFVEDGRLLSISTRVASDPANPEYASTVYNLQRDGISVETGQGFFGKDVKTMPRFPDLVNKPTVVLVNGMTASAGEIFASSVQENGDAKVVGTRTYGKGIGQTVINDMPNGSKLRVTSFRYYSPHGNWFGNAHDERIGVKPDFEVENPDSALRLSGADAQLARGLAVLNQEIAQRHPNR